MTSQLDAGVACLARKLCQAIGEPRYKLWFENKTRFSFDENTLTVGVPKLHLQEWIERSFGNVIRKTACEVFGPEAIVRFIIDSVLFQQARQEESHAKGEIRSPVVPPTTTSTESSVATTSNARKSFRRMRRLDSFVVGPCNRVAYAAALNLVEVPEDCLLPLVLHGPVGTGKTHLLEGIYTGLRQAQPDANLLFMTAEEFTNRFVQAMHQNKLSAFRTTFRQCDALLIDDVQFLAKKKATREEFLHTLDTLLSSGRSVVVTCDLHPRLTEEFPKELVDRLCGGAIWGLTLPDPATRLGILRAKSSRELPISEDVLAFLADQLRGNARELEGALHSVIHLARVHGTPITKSLAQTALGEMLRHSIRPVTPDDIERAVCQTLGIDTELLRSKKRAWQAALPRMLLIYLWRKHGNITYSEIGQRLGGRHHTTVLAQEKKMQEMWAENATVTVRDRPIAIREMLERIENALAR